MAIFEIFFLFQTPLSLPKCRRNVDNFLSACRRIGVAEVPIIAFFKYLN